MVDILILVPGVKAGRNHFDVVFEMCDPSSRVCTELFTPIGR